VLVVKQEVVGVLPVLWKGSVQWVGCVGCIESIPNSFSKSDS